MVQPKKGGDIMAKKKAKKAPQTSMDNEKQPSVMTSQKTRDDAQNRMTQKAASETPHCQAAE